MPPEAIEAQFRNALNQQNPTVMLVGGDTGAYGRDIGSNLPRLLERLLHWPGEHRVFVHDLNANWFLHDFVDYARLFEQQCAALRALCIPIQSGSDTVLRRMRRPYRISSVLRVLRLTRSLAPHVLLGTHIIAGFPGETDNDFEMTLRLLREFSFDFVTCFRYSEHASAPSHHLSPKVPEEVKVARLAQLREMLRTSATVLE